MTEPVSKREMPLSKRVGKLRPSRSMLMRAMRWAIERIPGLRERQTLRQSIETALDEESVADDELGSQERHMPVPGRANISSVRPSPPMFRHV